MGATHGVDYVASLCIVGDEEKTTDHTCRYKDPKMIHLIL